MSDTKLKTRHEANIYLNSKCISMDDQVNQEFLAMATHINFLHYEELILKARIQKVNEIFKP